MAVATIKRFVAGKATYSDQAIETNPTKIIERIKFIERVVHDAVVVLCGSDRVHYVSANCKNIIGISHTHFQSLTLEETIDLLFSDDVEGFKRCMEKVMSTTDIKHDKYKFIIHYRMINESGTAVVIEDEKIAVETTPGKYLFITFLRNISSRVVFNGVKLIIQKRIGENHFKTIDEFYPNSLSNTLTPRQSEILKLIGLGFQNKEIADKLNVSLSTVKNHKQILFKKTNVKNSIQLLSSMRHLGSQKL